MFTDLLLIHLIIFGTLMSIQDLKERIVKNYITYSFLGISFIFYIISKFIYGTSLSITIALVLTIIASFMLFHKKILGAADSKIIIGLTLLMLSFNNELYIFDFIINLIIIYSFVLILLCIFKTSIKNKTSIIKDTKYYLILFQTLFTLSIVSLFTRFIGFEMLDPLLSVGILLLILFISAPIAKKIYQKLDENSQIVISFTLFSYSFYELYNFFPISFIYLFLIKSFLSIIFELTHKIKYSNNHKSIALVPFLVISTILVLIFNKNLILVLIS